VIVDDPRSYFANAADANEWLDFDACGEEIEEKAYKESDRHAEWQGWRDEWAKAAAIDGRRRSAVHDSYWDSAR
jgi:hypothetical protein